MEFSFCYLEQIKYGFIEWVKSIYKNPKAAVITNCSSSDVFPLTRGTREGCPLSPLLSAIVIEPLASCVRDNMGIKGVKINDEPNISLYADDILYLTDPENSVPHLHDTIEQFWKILRI